jgi:hypothetical protein
MFIKEGQALVKDMNYGELEVLIHLAIRRQREIKTELEQALKSEVA